MADLTSIKFAGNSESELFKESLINSIRFRHKNKVAILFLVEKYFALLKIMFDDELIEELDISFSGVATDIMEQKVWIQKESCLRKLGIRL